jgi:phosphatidylserine decarboxylase
MDPFVVISLGRKTYRTRVIRHNLNPIYDEKLLFQVAKHETNYSISFSVVDRDNFTSNDYVGKVDLPLEKVISAAPDADPQTGLYTIPDGMRTPTAEYTDTKRPRFRLGLSRSSSSQSLSKQARLTAQNHSKSPGGHLNVQTNDPPPPTSNPSEGVNAQDLSKALSADAPDDGFNPFVLPLNLKNKQKWESKSPTLYIRAKYLPYTALRQQFWRAMLRQYDADESGRIDKLELTTMLDSLGSTLLESTVDKFFDRFPEDNPGDCPSVSFDEAVICLEDELQRTSRKRPPLFHAVSNNSNAGDDSGSGSPSAATSSMAGLSLTPSMKSAFLASQEAAGKEAEDLALALDSHDLNDDRDEEHVIEIRECPICHQPRLNKRSDSDIVTHISTCASQDWRRVNNIVMAGFVTASQAQRKWYSKVMTKISYGGYKLGANSANILVQDRITGQIQEERMSVYVRLGIRLLYKGLRSNTIEKKRSKPCTSRTQT